MRILWQQRCSPMGPLVPVKQGGEWASKQRLFGLPVIHVATGYDPLTGRIRIAKGIIAIGNVAVGGVAVGGVSLGAIAIGGVTAGITSLGGIALALWMAFGGVTQTSTLKWTCQTPSRFWANCFSTPISSAVSTRSMPTTTVK